MKHNNINVIKGEGEWVWSFSLSLSDVIAHACSVGSVVRDYNRAVSDRFLFTLQDHAYPNRLYQSREEFYPERFRGRNREIGCTGRRQNQRGKPKNADV